MDTSSLFSGLKEFADGEATLCAPESLSEHDDFGRWLNDDQPTLNASFLDYFESPDLTCYASPSKSESESVKNDSKIVFEEDPLSCLLNTSSSLPSLKRPRKPAITRVAKKRINRLFSPPQSTVSTGPIMIQYRQRRFAEDSYSPLMVRGRGAGREGCCPLCNDCQVWLKIKQSAYWYHMNFFHGICAATGRPYPPPAEIKRQAIQGKPESVRVYGSCADCQEWILLANELSKHEESIPMNAWYKHSQKCQNRTVSQIDYPDTS